jgi:hypothetical protein
MMYVIHYAFCLSPPRTHVVRDETELDFPMYQAAQLGTVRSCQETISGAYVICSDAVTYLDGLPL